ncbi:MAG: phosphoribosylglycinamide formyltransferase [Alphaproteobacteria bacterium]
MAEKMKVGVLISGRGSNLQALLDAAANPGYPARIARVVSNVPDAAGLQRAAAAGVQTAVVNHRDYPSRAAFDDALNRDLRDAGIELVCLAGFMRLLTAEFVESWGDRIINIHPSLLPSFKGVHAHRDAIAAGARFSGCTVHFVRPEMDSGPIILQAAVPVGPDDDEARLAARVLEQEHAIYPLAVRLIAEGRIAVDGARVRIAGAACPQGAMIGPAV